MASNAKKTLSQGVHPSCFCMTHCFEHAPQLEGGKPRVGTHAEYNGWSQWKNIILCLCMHVDLVAPNVEKLQNLSTPRRRRMAEDRYKAKESGRDAAGSLFCRCVDLSNKIYK